MRIGTLFLLLLVTAVGCRFTDVNILPDAPGQYEALGLKFNFRSEDQRQNGKILWKLRESHSQLVVLGPFNQALAEAYTSGEQMTLLNRKRRMFWQGEFREFLDYYWHLEFTMAEIAGLVRKGLVPEKLEEGLNIKVENEKGNGAVKRIVIAREASTLTITVNKREARRGSFAPAPALSGLSAVSLERIFHE